MQRLAWGIVLAIGAGCGSKSTDREQPQAAPTPAADAAPVAKPAPPPRIDIGACVAGQAVFTARLRPPMPLGTVGKPRPPSPGGHGRNGGFTPESTRVGSGDIGGSGAGGMADLGSLGSPGLRMPVPPSSEVKFEKIVVAGGSGLEEPIVRRMFRRYLSQLRYCYERRLQVNPGLRGAESLQMVIDATGRTIVARADGFDKEVGDCIAARARAWAFPAATNGGQTMVQARFQFRVPEPTGLPPPRRKPRPRPKPAPVDAGPAIDYAAVATEALRERAGELGGCIGDATAALVLELEVDGQGAVTASRVHGDVDAKVAGCLADKARAITVAGAVAGPIRCPLAVGHLSLAGLPRVHVARDAVEVDGKPVADAAAIAAPAKPSWKIDALYQALRGSDSAGAPAPAMEPLPEDDAPPVVGGSPRHAVVGAEADAPAALVLRVLNTARAAELEPILVDAGGAPIREADLPRPPYPLPAPDAADPVVSIRIDDSGIALALGGENATVPAAGGAPDLAKVSTLLTAWRARPELGDRNPRGKVAEISATGAVTWAALLPVLDAAAAAGFTDWELLPAR